MPFYLHPPPGTWDEAEWEGPPAYSGTLADFVRWNEESWIPWICSAYDDAEPFYRRREQDFAQFLTDEALGKLAQDKRELDATLELLAKEAGGEDGEGVEFFDKVDYYEGLGIHRVTVVAHALREQLIGEERHGRLYTRFFCPELTFANFENPGFLLNLISKQMRLEEKVDFQVIRQIDFERLVDPDSEERSTRLPQSRGLRAFVEQAYVSRHLCIAQFSLLVLRILGQLQASDRSPVVLMEDANLDQLRQLLRSLRVAPPRHPIDPRCANCLTPRSKKPLSACGRCQAQVKRTVWFCGAECQKAAWPKHKVDCGKPFLEAGLVPSTGRLRHQATGAKDIVFLAEMMRTPRAVWGFYSGLESDEEDDDINVDPSGFFFYLPLFVSPYRPTLKALTDLRNDLLIGEKDQFSIGVVALFMRHAYKYAVVKDFERWPVEEALHELAASLQLMKKEVTRAEEYASAQLTVRTDETARLIASCFEQLKTGKSDPAFPPVTMTPAVLEPFDRFSAVPNIYFIWRAPRFLSHRPDMASFPASWHPLPDFIKPHDETLEAIRELAFRGLEDSADYLSIGAYTQCVLLSERIKGAGSGQPSLKKEHFEMLIFDMIAQFFGFDEDVGEQEIGSMREDAVAELEEQEGKEWELVRGAIKQMEDKYAELLASGAILPPTKPKHKPQRHLKMGKRRTRFK